MVHNQDPALLAKDKPVANLSTRAGEKIDVRIAEPSDRSIVQDFFEKISPEDLRFRFLTTLRRIDSDRLTLLCAGERSDTLTFLAFHAGTLAAVATLAKEADGHRAEVALSTSPEWKKHGISWTLLDHVIRFARGHGIDELISIESADDHAAIQLERDMGFSIDIFDDDGREVVATKALHGN